MVFNQSLSRRDFLKLSAGSTAALGLLFVGIRWPEGVHAADPPAVAEVPVIWLQGGSCAGCSVSALNTLSPKIQDVLVDQVIPGYHVSLRFHPNVMAASGELAMSTIYDAINDHSGGYLLVVEGEIPTKDEGVYCEVGETGGHGIPVLTHVKDLGSNAMAVIALGTCATHGGIPSAAPNPTGAKGVKEVFTDEGIDTPVINVPGCPPHPDWFVGTVASILIGGLESVAVDQHLRPLAFYGKLIHDNCPRRGHFDNGQFSKKYSDPYCMYQLGCKGPVTYADCPTRLWNSGTSWCVGANSLCIGCVEPGFPDDTSPFMKAFSIDNTATLPSWLPSMEEEGDGGFNPGLAAGIGAVAGLAVGAGAVAIAKSPDKKQGEAESK